MSVVPNLACMTPCTRCTCLRMLPLHPVRLVRGLPRYPSHAIYRAHSSRSHPHHTPSWTHSLTSHARLRPPRCFHGHWFGTDILLSLFSLHLHSQTDPPSPFAPHPFRMDVYDTSTLARLYHSASPLQPACEGARLPCAPPPLLLTLACAPLPSPHTPYTASAVVSPGRMLYSHLCALCACVSVFLL